MSISSGGLREGVEDEKEPESLFTRVAPILPSPQQGEGNFIEPWQRFCMNATRSGARRGLAAVCIAATISYWL
jgi:hypothetical protein